MADFHVFTNTEDLSQAAADYVAELATEAIRLRGRFVVALSGGSTPRRLFELLADAPYKEQIQWDKVVILWGDDRAVAPDNEFSNYRLAATSLLMHVDVPEKQVLRIRGELGADQAAVVMENDLVDVFGDTELPRFDLVLQGMGGDGHTASLFPGIEALESDKWVVPVIDPPANPKVDRVTLTLPVLNNARLALFLAAGESKRKIISEIMNDPDAGDRYPAARVEAEKTVWFVDEAAFGSGLKEE